MRSLKPSWRSRTYQVRTHIDSTSDQGIKNYHSLTEQKTRYWHNDAKSHKACLVLVFNLAELNRSFLALDKLRSRGSVFPGLSRKISKQLSIYNIQNWIIG